MKAYFLVCLVFLGSLGIKADFTQSPNAQTPPAEVQPGTQEEKVYTSLAEALKEPLKVKVLALHNLDSIPADIAKLENLTDLTIVRFSKSKLPSVLWTLSKLKSLRILECPIIELSPEIGKLRNLQALHLMGSQVKSLPTEIGSLKSLETLDLHANQLNSLPDSICLLGLLSDLGVSDNQLKSLPNQLEKLTLLEAIDLSGNQLELLPPEITKLQKLELLDVHHNQLKDLPIGLNKMQSLYTLHAGFNLYSKLPFDFHSFPKLKMVILDLQRVPNRQIEQLTNTSSQDLILVSTGEKFISGRINIGKVDQPNPAKRSTRVSLLNATERGSRTQDKAYQTIYRLNLFQTNDQITRPVVTRSIKPRYSNRARENYIQGKVFFHFTFQSNGKTGELQLDRSLGLGLDEQAILALLDIEFEPATKNGTPISVRSRVEFSFYILDEDISNRFRKPLT